MSAPTPRRLYTPAEANEALPLVRPVVAALRRAVADVRAAAPAVEAFGARTASSGGTQPTAEERLARGRYRAGEEAATRAFAELAELGVLVKDAARGLVDFPSLRDGEVVELCWLDGEPSVAHWHRVGEGFAGRRPLTDPERPPEP
jgi:hypothetical protein